MFGLDAGGSQEPLKEFKSSARFRKMAMEAGIGGRIQSKQRQARGWEEL